MPDGSSTREPTSTRYAWYVVAVLTLASISANVDQLIISLLVGPIKRDLHITDVQISYIAGAAFAIFFAVLGLPIARLADQSNRRNVMAGGVALWSVFTTLCASARTFGQLFAMRLGVGVGEATRNGPGVSLLADYFPRERLARAMSVYQFGVFFGAGMAYFIGGWIVGLLATDDTWVVPVIGTIHPWQSVFLIIGLPGLAIALLFFTIREPERRNGPPIRLPFSVLVRYITANRRTFLTQSLGFGSSALVNFAIAFWNPEFFHRQFGWSLSRAGKTQGILTMTVGTIGALAGGWIADRFVSRGRIDGPLRVGMIGAAGMLVAATAYPLMPTATLAICGLAVVNVFAALPWGAASAAAAEVVPAPLRAQGAALYFFVVGLVSTTLGPSSVAWLTVHVFHDEQAIRYSLAIVNVTGMTFALILLSAGLTSYRRTVADREHWEP